MKGIEVTFRGKTICCAIEENKVIDVSVEKKDTCVRYAFGGLKTETNKLLFYTLDHAEDLKTGDEIVIRRKEIDKISEPVYIVTENKSQYSEYPDNLDEKAKMLQNMLAEFRKLESKLKESRLID
jgi:hypothetical protein